jgi:hypothetical protein
MDLIAETPARGILKLNEWGSSKMYKIVCECGSDDCTHTIDIEAEDNSVSVTIYTKTRTNFWSKTRWYHIWQLLTKGYVESETVIIMHKQVALNYANVLQLAVKDVEEMKKMNTEERLERKRQLAIAQEGDCV